MNTSSKPRARVALTDSVAWHREQARMQESAAEWSGTPSGVARSHRAAAAHHTRAADALEALAVPGVASALAYGLDKFDGNREIDEESDRVVAALRDVVRIAQAGDDR